MIRLIIVLTLFGTARVYAQGHIDHIKNQPYLDIQVDCDNQPGDNLSLRICENLAFQKSDSILVRIYDSVLVKAKTHFIDSLAQKIILLQKTWRLFRDQQCDIVYASYEDCGACHLRAIEYLQCLRKCTEVRIQELRELLEFLN